MARLIPSTVHSTIRSGAERRLFKLFGDTPGTESWIVLHSLGLARHEHKRRGEIDFLVVCPLGIFVLEVKGGRVRRDKGEWVFTDRYDVEQRKAEGPFDQASSAMFSLEKALKVDGLPFISNVLFGYGVVLPDIRFDDVGAEDHALVYDRRDRERSLATYVTRLAAFHRGRSHKNKRGLSPAEIETVADHLRGDFDLVPSLATLAEDIRSQLVTLTRAQSAVLNTFAVNPRVLVDGPAGCGSDPEHVEEIRNAA